MRALITGVGGFIGSFMVRSFLNSGWRVTGVCRKHHPTRLAGLSCLDFVVTDLRECNGLPDQYDYLVHCAADVPAYCSDENELYHSNVEGTRCLLDHAATVGVRRVAYMSSMAVYGTISVPVVDESTASVEPDIYGRSKAEGEKLLAAWTRRTDGAGVSLRLPGVVGVGGRNNFLCDSLQRILNGQPVTARNPNSLFNNVLHVQDLAAWVVGLADRMPKGATALTIASQQPLTIRNMLARLYQRAGRKEQINWQDEIRKTPFLIAFDHARTLGYRPATVGNCIDRIVSDTLKEENPS